MRSKKENKDQDQVRNQAAGGGPAAPSETPVAADQTAKPDQEPGVAEGTEAEAASAENTDEAELKRITDALNKSQKDLADLTDNYMRLMAEFDNFRRRSRSEKEALYGQSVTDVVAAWLPVVDNLERAEQACQKVENDEAKQIADGVVMVLKQVDAVLQKFSVKEIDAINQPFDPALHQAVLHVEDDQYGSNTVIEVLEKGYKREDTVIRHAMVKVAN
ncbi:nucleotide exchange factor GrpE [Oscillospiraceae bacterium HV4-5-C5C]|nr:nucleotide exchange factor GrpE [Oscillospiraceae bacterium HV4-5-C5C]